MSASYEEIAARLTAPGAPSELETRHGDGREVRTFARRERSMREKVARAGERGEVEFHVQGGRV